MPDPSDEPASQAAVADWIRTQTRAHDRYASVYDASEQHRIEHGGECDVYPSASGPLLGALAAAARAKRILEVGCGLGYSALWLADGAGPDGTVETCEKDPVARRDRPPPPRRARRRPARHDPRRARARCAGGAARRV